MAAELGGRNSGQYTQILLREARPLPNYLCDVSNRPDRSGEYSVPCDAAR